jgi:hypothetical protein
VSSNEHQEQITTLLVTARDLNERIQGLEETIKGLNEKVVHRKACRKVEMLILNHAFGAGTSFHSLRRFIDALNVSVPPGSKIEDLDELMQNRLLKHRHAKTLAANAIQNHPWIADIGEIQRSLTVRAAPILPFFFFVVYYRGAGAKGEWRCGCPRYE